jgi:starch synthase
VKNFNIDSLKLRASNKKALLQEVGLPEQPGTPLFILIGRMDRQKGVDLAFAALRKISAHPWQAILLGTGDIGLETAAKQLENEFPQRVKTVLRFDERFSRHMYGGGDILLMPSRYEPCGLAQMIAMRYGCIPAARATGGLIDTITDHPDPSCSTGFLFDDATPEALADAMQRAMAAYRNSKEWQARQRCGMQQNFSWQRSAQSYAEIYAKLHD